MGVEWHADQLEHEKAYSGIIIIINLLTHNVKRTRLQYATVVNKIIES